MEKDETLGEVVAGVRLTPSERKLLIMKVSLVDSFKKNPSELTAFKRMMQEIRDGKKRITIRLNAPEIIEALIKKMDNCGIQSANRTIITMIIYQFDSILEELSGDK